FCSAFNNLEGGGEFCQSTRQRSSVAKWIRQISTEFTQAKIVVTCRSAARDSISDFRDFLPVHIPALSFEQISDFIRNWYSAVICPQDNGTSRGEDIAHASNLADNLIESLNKPDASSAKMRMLATNIFMLHTICIVHHSRVLDGNCGLPHGREELYDECVTIMLNHERRHGSAREDRKDLERIALWLHSQDLFEVAKSDISTALGISDTFLEIHCNESGLLIRSESGKYAFKHPGFQEYLTACEVRKKCPSEAIEFLAKHYDDDRWQEVILLFLAHDKQLESFLMGVIRWHPKGYTKSLLLDAIFEEAAGVDTSFQFLLDFVQQSTAEHDNDQWEWGWKMLCFLERLAERDHQREKVTNLATRLERHEMAKFREWANTKLNRRTIRTTKGDIELVEIEAGEFKMGTNDNIQHPSEYPQINKIMPSFYLGKFLVTNKEYRQFLEANPEVRPPDSLSDPDFGSDSKPVVGVSWHEACQFAEWAGGRLPSEAEWEYAARAGSTTDYWWGNQMDIGRANGRETGCEWSKQQTSPVGSFPPNYYGLYDTCGNAREWVQDKWHHNYRGNPPTDGSPWENDADTDQRVIRGGGWSWDNIYLRSAHRDPASSEYKDNSLGFRIAKDM
ncbi:MAG: SUMF1/EgtB/PvdO family nonheme iron enzyme, partial [Candidatus Methylumidiphilus sp.]